MTMEIVRKNVVFFSYWTYMTMEIIRKNVVFFGYWTYMTIGLYDYGLGTQRPK